MMPICYYHKCNKPAEVNIGKLDVKDGDIIGQHWLTTIYLCKEHANKIARQLCVELYMGGEE